MFHTLLLSQQGSSSMFLSEGLTKPPESYWKYAWLLGMLDSKLPRHHFHLLLWAKSHKNLKVKSGNIYSTSLAKDMAKPHGKAKNKFQQIKSLQSIVSSHNRQQKLNRISNSETSRKFPPNFEIKYHTSK